MKKIIDKAGAKAKAACVDLIVTVVAIKLVRLSKVSVAGRKMSKIVGIVRCL